MYLSDPSAFERSFVPQRPVVLFGHEVEVRRGTALTFSPLMVFYAASGESLKAKLESDERTLWNVLRAIVRTESSGGKLRPATSKAFARESLRNGDFSPLTVQLLEELPDSIAAPWRIVFRCRHDLHRAERRMLTRLATADRLAHLITGTKDPAESMRRRQIVFGPGLNYWVPTGLGLPWQCIAPLDAALCVLGRLEREFTTAMPQVWSRASITELVATELEPLRAWFGGLLRLTACSGYPQFADFLTVNGYSTKGTEGVNPGRLAKWANGLEPMRAGKAAGMLLACGAPVQPAREMRRFLYARVLTFLVEWACACADSPPDRQKVQQAVHQRLVQWRDAG